MELTQLCEDVSNQKIVIESELESRDADIPLYISNNSKVQSKIGWEPAKNIQEIVGEIFHWISTNENQLKPILN